MRKDSIAEFTKAGRNDLAEQNQREIEIVGERLRKACGLQKDD